MTGGLMGSGQDRPLERHSGVGELQTADGKPLAKVRYDYSVDRTNRVWSGTATPLDEQLAATLSAGPAILVTEQGQLGPVHIRLRRGVGAEAGQIIVTGRGAPPGE